MFRNILPNATGPVLVAGTFGAASAILTEAGLSFFGLGVEPPIASWGNMLNDAQSMTVLHTMPWLWVPPGVMTVIAVLAINFVGDGIRDALDPRLQLQPKRETIQCRPRRGHAVRRRRDRPPGLDRRPRDHRAPVLALQPQQPYLRDGAAPGVWLSFAYSSHLQPNLVLIGRGQWSLVSPILLGLAIHVRFFKPADYLARWSRSFFAGYGAGHGLAFQPAVFLGQLTGSFYQRWGNTTAGISLHNWVSAVLPVATVVYFFFTVRRNRGAVKSTGQLARCATMVAFGATFGAQILFRCTLPFGRVYFLFHDWLHRV